MGKKLIIVESPTKIKTLKKFLGSNYLFESSLGHIRDLPAKGFGIDVENDFEPQYSLLPDKKEVIERLKKAAKEVEEVYLSPDPDREGEAIAWHIASILPKGVKIKRVSFNAITKEAVEEALAHPTQINQALVNAQQARRLLDRIVGYKISPILARRIQRGKTGSVSAGRVQSVALKLVVDREKEIEAFKAIEYWNILASLLAPKSEKPFQAHLFSVDGKRLEKEIPEGKESQYFTIGDQKTADDFLMRLEKIKEWSVVKVERKEKKRYPVPPFITSTLQQEASRHHGFSAARTMSCAQSLYEGVELGSNGHEGLITYMRTDSVRIAPEAISEARQYILKQYGPEFLPAEPKYYSSKKSAQDAHEAIRPSSLRYPPETIKQYLTRDQYLLYSLIWKRFVASQMNPAIYDTVSADIAAGESIIFRTSGSVVKFAGFLTLYEEKEDEQNSDGENRLLPYLEEGQSLLLKALNAEQSFTKSPPRYTEASLVKELEKSGIGRPSTYASIMNKIQSREYTVKEGLRLKPTELGRVIAQFLEQHFTQIMTINFTSKMEDDLELVAESQKDWKVLIKDFWHHFIPTIEEAEQSAFVPKVMTELPCPKCAAPLQKIWSHSRYFFGCSHYPDCDYSASAEELAFNKDDFDPSFNWEQPCPLCSSVMKVRHGRFGAFLGCTGYPKCKGIINIPKVGEEAVETGPLDPCPAVGCDGHMNARKSRFGKIFYSCSNYPDCDVIVNQLDQLKVKYVDHPKTPYVKKGKASKGKKETGAKKKAATKTPKTPTKKSDTEKAPKKRSGPQYKVSPELFKIVQKETLTRPELMKAVWDYIKAHKLQDPKNGRLICPDASLSDVTGSTEAIDMMQLPKLLTPHLEKE